MTVSDEYVPRVNFFSRMGAGVVGGVVGGVLLAAALWPAGFFQDKDFIKPYGQLIGDDTLSTALVMLLCVAGAAGAIFGTVLGRFITGQIIPAIGVGLVWGMVSWVLLALLVLPIRGEGGILSIPDAGGIIVLGVYVAFGVATTVMYAIAGPRRKYYYRRRYYDGVVAMPTFVRPRRRRRKKNGDDD
jgi:drug/metabolite transporter (DMT)-like permease